MNTHNKKAIVTLAIGDKYQRLFRRYCQDTWKHYCARHSYDLIVVTRHLDNSARGRDRSPAWQKLLILSQEWSKAYEQIVWMDTDIIINNQLAPDIASLVPADKVGAVENYAIPSREIHEIALKRKYEAWHQKGIKFVNSITPGLYYENRDLPGGHLDRVAQTGVFVCSPRQHQELFEHIYYSYEDKHKSAEWNYEMPAMSYELVKNDKVHWLSPHFNLCVSNMISAFYSFLFDGASPEKAQLRDESLTNIFHLGYFIHFAGCAEMMENLHLRLQNPHL